jgi:mono/diheme cytochrome c family protein
MIFMLATLLSTTSELLAHEPIGPSATVVVPFAVPVATPVAIVQNNGVFYRAAPESVAGDSSIDDPSRRRLFAEFEAFLAWRASRGQSATEANATQSSLSLVGRNCLQCHGGPNPKGGVSLDGALSADVRLRAIRETVAGRMPPQSKLSPELVGQLLGELAGESQVDPSAQTEKEE